MPTWIAIGIVDHLVATKFPALSFDPLHSGTVVGGLLNLGMWLALLFWPSAGYVYTPPVIRLAVARARFRHRPVAAKAWPPRASRVWPMADSAAAQSERADNRDPSAT